MMEEPKLASNDLPDFGTMLPRSQKRRYNWLWLVIAIIVIVVLAYFFLFNNKLSGSNSGYKAIFLTNGQVYFGQLTRETGRYLYLDNVYYIQLQEQTQPAVDEKSQPTTIQVPTLLKRGSELHQPDGSMLINSEQVVAIENVGADSQIMSEINSSQKAAQ